MQPRRRKGGDYSVARPGRVRFRRNHGENGMAIFVEHRRTEHERWTTFYSSFIGERERHNYHVPRITNHEMPRRPPASSTRQAWQKALDEMRHQMARPV